MELREPAATVAAGAPARPAARRGPPVKLIIAGVAALVVFAYLVSTAMSTSAVYYLKVGELRAKGAAAYNTPVRVGGQAAGGSIVNDPATQTLRFTLTDATGTLRVVYTGIVPDMFGYAANGKYQDAVVEGELHPDGVFYATQIIVKHDARFAAADAAATAEAGKTAGRAAP